MPGEGSSHPQTKGRTQPPSQGERLSVRGQGLFRTPPRPGARAKVPVGEKKGVSPCWVSEMYPGPTGSP